MKAKDTVISLGEIDNESLRILMTKILEHQAELSFKAGYDQGYLDVNDQFAEGRYRAGIRTVVKWCDKNFEPTVPMSLDYRKWHKQKKDWGIDG